jgi:hypothetical protein
MKTSYQCDICGEKSDSREYIEACEAKGHPDLSLCPPIGLLVGDAHGPGPVCEAPHLRGEKGPKSDGRCDHLCGVGFIWVVQWAGVSHHDKHEYGVGFGNFRGNGAGDTFDFKGAKGGYDTFKMGKSKYYPEQGFRRWQEWPEARECPAFYRAVKALREAKIQPMVLRNGEAVPFNDPVPVDPYENFPLGTYVRLKQSVKSTNCDKCGGSGVLVEMDDDRTHVPCDCRTAVAKVQGYIYEKEGGLKLDRKIGGFAYWNVADVEAAP